MKNIKKIQECTGLLETGIEEYTAEFVILYYLEISFEKDKEI